MVCGRIFRFTVLLHMRMENVISSYITVGIYVLNRNQLHVTYADDGNITSHVAINPVYTCFSSLIRG